MKYRLIGIDVDGTLLGADHELPRDVAEAVRRARRAGMLVVLATGRTYAETAPIWRKLEFAPPLEPLVLVGGALVCEPDTGRTLYQKAIPLDLAGRLGEAFAEAGYAAMAAVDPWRHGWDYLLCQTGDVHAARRDWLSKIGAKVRRVERFDQAADLPDPLRVTVVVDPDKAAALAARIKTQFDGQLNVHAIFAPNYGVMMVEAFAAGCDKLSALRYVAQAHLIGMAEVAVIGDDVNDLTMIRGAGLGAAMPWAPADLLSAADYVAAGGLVEFLDRLVAGAFD